MIFMMFYDVFMMICDEIYDIYDVFMMFCGEIYDIYDVL